MKNLESKFEEPEPVYKRIGTELAAAAMIACIPVLQEYMQTEFPHLLSASWISPTAVFLFSFAALWLFTSRKGRAKKSLLKDYLPFLSGNNETVRLGYEVYEHERFSHNGHVRITGYRQYERDKSVGDSNTVYPVPIPIEWHSNWCQVCTDGHLRFDYQLNRNDDIILGLCDMSPNEGGPVKKLYGHYRRLYPLKDCDFAPVCGTIEFHVINNDPVVPPPGFNQTVGPSVHHRQT